MRIFTSASTLVVWYGDDVGRAIPTHPPSMTEERTMKEALETIRQNRRVCEVLAATARHRKEYAQAQYYNGKVDAYDVVEGLILAALENEEK